MELNENEEFIFFFYKSYQTYVFNKGYIQYLPKQNSKCGKIYKKFLQNLQLKK